MKKTSKTLGWLIRILAVAICTMMSVTVFFAAACGGKTPGQNEGPGGDKPSQGKQHDPETTPVTFSIGELDGVFNPFFSTSAYDSEITGMTTIGMLSTDANGGITYGRDEAVMTLDYTSVMRDKDGQVTQTGSSDGTTTYEFLIKNGVKDSKGSPVTIEDILFNIYVYLDPVYNGSSTMYSTKIQGLAKYKTGADSDEEANAFENLVTSTAVGERQQFIAYANYKDGSDPTKYPKLPEYDDDAIVAKYEGYKTKLWQLFDDMLKSDWNSAASTMETVNESYILVDPIEYRTNKVNPRTYDITRVWEYFLIIEGLAQNVEVNGEYSLKTGEGNDQTVRYYVMIDNGMIEAIEEAIAGKTNEDDRTEAEKSVVFESMQQEYKTYGKVETLALYFSINTDFLSHLRDMVRADLLQTSAAKNISGITTRKTTTFNGKTYASEHDVLSITINGIDPKAIWNFAFAVVPMKYYASAEEVSHFDGVENFGLKKGDPVYRDTYLKNPDRIGLPVGAGPYMASTATGGAASNAAQFRDKNVVYFERNPYFYTLGIDSETATEADYAKSASEADTAIHNAKVKYLRYQVISTTAVMNAMIAQEIDFSSDISAKQDNINTLNGYKSYITYARQPNNGYGYIGVNPKYVKDIEVRRIIMYAMDRAYITEDYYTDGLGSIIERPMTTNSWAYPEDAQPYYTVDWFIKHYKEKYNVTLTPPADPTTPDSNFIDQMLKALGYTKSGGVYQKNLVSGVESKLEYTFTIAGETKDHPAYAVFSHAAETLNAAGMKIKVKTDATALSKLANATLSVWAAAWSSTIDPDMYQVYHKYSQATSVNNWGYSEILSDSKGVYTEEQRIINALSTEIDLGRSYLEQELRVGYYYTALDYVMELAVELPTYQRVNLLVYNSGKIDPSSLTPASQLTAYNGLINKIWELDLR